MAIVSGDGLRALLPLIHFFVVLLLVQVAAVLCFITHVLLVHGIIQMRRQYRLERPPLLVPFRLRLRFLVFTGHGSLVFGVGEVGLAALPHRLTLQGLLLLVIVNHKGLLVRELLGETMQGPLQDTLHEGVIRLLRGNVTLLILLGSMGEGI